MDLVPLAIRTYVTIEVDLVPLAIRACVMIEVDLVPFAIRTYVTIEVDLVPLAIRLYGMKWTRTLGLRRSIARPSSNCYLYICMGRIKKYSQKFTKDRW